MAENSGIEWTDHTFNPWEGCQKVAPECDNCYAEARDLRFTGGRHWGPKAPRRKTSPQNWKKPLKWNAQAKTFYATHGRRQRVFCASLADVFDNAVDPAWRDDLWELIWECDQLDWLILTKRPQNMIAMLPEDWGQPMQPNGWPHVWLGTSAGTQKTADQNIPHLLKTPAAIRFVSVEPMLGPISLSLLRVGPRGSGRVVGSTYDALTGEAVDSTDAGYNRRPNNPKLDWVICGGESGQNARPTHPKWATSLRDQCQNAGTAFFFKQWGEWAPAFFEGQWNEDYYDGPLLYLDDATCGVAHRENDGDKMEGRVWLPDGTAGHWTEAPDEWGDSTQREASIKIGKKRAGRLLDGREWNEVPA